jgi:SAM-dependent methyltransferase
MLASLDDYAGLLRHPGRPEERVVVTPGRTGAAEAASALGAFPVVHGRPVLIDFDRSVVRRSDLGAEGVAPLIDRKPHSGLRRAIKALFPSTRRSRANFGALIAATKAAADAPILLVVGGGTRGEGSRDLYADPDLKVVAFDVYPSADLAFIADGHAIPLADGSVDAVVVQAVLEHVVDPARIVAEILRVLKPGGHVYAETPFLQHVHEGPYDFWRFTESGHRLLFCAFEPLARGTLGGPGLSAYWAIRALMRDLTRSRAIGGLLSLPFLPLAFLDHALPEARQIDSANGVYFLGRKPAQAPAAGVTSAPHPVDIYLGHQR